MWLIQIGIVMNQKLKNAIAIIKQIKNGEWEFEGHYPYSFRPYFKCYTAKRKNIELWVANGAFSCSIHDEPQQLGFYGILVWFFAARKEVKNLERKMHRKTNDLTT